jgi:hypothetical protein
VKSAARLASFATRLRVAVLCALLSACASLPTLSERPEDYHLYRAVRVAPTQEQRLRAAFRYLREVPGGERREQVQRWFEHAEERYYLEAFQRLPNLYAYVEALPQGPHIAEVRSRIAAIEARRSARSEHEIKEDKRIAATQERLAQADISRRAFVAVVKDWTSRLVRIQSFGQPTSELDHETIFAFRLSPPRGVCQGDKCRKLQDLRFEVPGERELVARAALLEVELQLERGLLTGARYAGPELWTRLAEALSLTPLPSPTPEQRADALNRSALLIRAVLEPLLPAAQCEVKAQAPVVLERHCRGLRVRMLAGQGGAEDDALEISAALLAAASPAAAQPASAPAAAPAAP